MSIDGSSLTEIILRRLFVVLSSVAVLLSGANVLRAAKPTPAQLEFFENYIRPVLTAQCYECHNSRDAQEGGLALDHRAALLAGGDSGKAVAPGKPAESLLLKILRHEVEGLEMPQGGEKLSNDVVEQFEKWIAMGAPDPRDKPPSAAELAEATSWEAIRAKRMAWWSFQPLKKPLVPDVAEAVWSAHPIDRFVLARLQAEGLTPARPADRGMLLRRLCFAITGLPPTPAQLEAFAHDDRPDAYERLVDELLDSEAFGERWARHWMDWVRYAESHGSEGDPAIPHAYRYRDYLIRALNADVPYDQLVREHIAGDLLPEPRINEELGINESAIGPAHWRMVFHGFAPTDALDEKVRFTDDQINVFSKAFLGLTVSCARCHDHKFDAISQRDYYALFGILGSTHPATIDVNTQPRQQLHKQELSRLKGELRETLAVAWLEEADAAVAKLLEPTGYWKTAIEQASDPSHVLNPWVKFNGDGWKELRAQAELEQRAVEEHRRRDYTLRWNLADGDDFDLWFTSGNSSGGEGPRVAEFTITANGERIVDRVFPAGFLSHGLSTRHRAVLASPRFQLDGEHDLWIRVAGDGDALARYVVQNYPRRGTVYPVTELKDGQWRWQKYDLSYWNGEQLHLEFTTAPDTAILVTGNDRSWFGVREAVLVPHGEPGPPTTENVWLEVMSADADSDDAAPATREAFAKRYARAMRLAVEAWRQGEMTDRQAFFLDGLLAAGLLPNRPPEVPAAAPLLAEYRRLEAKVPLPTRVPGLMEADAFDQPLFVRGDHRLPGQPVPRRFLEAIDPTPYETGDSGRLELARDLLRPDNPFTARVAANRIWHYLFGQGIVPTTDNFGRLGETPSHPELLDYLAVRLRENGWSIKDAVRFMVTSKTWRLDSRPSDEAKRLDPSNRLLSHGNVRRLDAESIRDNLLAVSGRLDRAMYGPGVAANFGSTRRSVYVRVFRNSLDELLAVFDAPVPFATQGRRDVTNVPAQSLTLLNDPFLHRLAGDWAAKSIGKAEHKNAAALVEQMFYEALARRPTPEERNALVAFVESLSRQYATAGESHTRLQREIRQRTADAERILDAARERLAAKDGASNTSGSAEFTEALRPLARWTFDDGLQDLFGKLHGVAHGKARVEGGALVVDGQSYVATKTLDVNLQQKTLEAWVMLDDSNQRGGGVMSVQDTSGGVFDALVFGERRPRRWLAGSNHFARTDDFHRSGDPSDANESDADESDADKRMVHVAIVYHVDGTIRGYRDGRPYGQPYRKSAPVAFAAGKSQVLFGLRHGAPGGNRLLKGRIFEARLYDRALSADEVAKSHARFSGGVTNAQLIKALTDAQRTSYQRLQRKVERLQKEIESLGPPPAPRQAWIDLAHAIFNLKEFIYVR
ncbi:MAG: DUF1553 domain-containing protein [Pirellulaceae bacterium]